MNYPTLFWDVHLCFPRDGRQETQLVHPLGALLGAVIMAAFSMVSNYYIVYPIYTKFMPMDVIIAAYSSILPSIKNLWQALFVFNLPFTFAKGLVNVLIATLIYKPLSPILKGKNI